MTERLVRLISEIETASAPDDVREKVKLCLLDYLAATVAGVASRLPSVEIMTDYIVAQEGRPEATLIADGRQVPAAGAVLVNSIAGEVLELGDGENRIIGHPGQSIIPAVLAAAEMKGADGRSILTAILAGYEAMIFVGEAVIPEAYDLGFSASACLGNFGAAAGAARIFGLSPEQISHTLALAASASGYLRSWNLTGTMDKDLMVGEATRRGMVAAQLARAGYTGTSQIREGDLGFCRAMSGQCKEVKRDKDQYRIRDVYFKPYPSCRATHSTIDAVLSLVENNPLPPDQVENIVIYTDTHGAQVSIAQPESFVSVRFSHQFSAVATLLEGKASLHQYSEEYARRPEVKDLLSRTEVRIDPEMEDSWPDKYSARVEINTRDGKSYSSQVDHPKGDRLNPLTRADVLAKAEELLGLAYPQDRVKAVIEAVMTAEKIEQIDQLMDLVGP
ncbi:MAG: MmgE/PrpD family protein [Deltaproteobacteria bacterium]|nr:MmgE/PrpD family protein [Deltaproteobacteria bacterium]